MASLATGQPQPLRILMLHGYSQSGASFRQKTRFLESALRKAFPASHPEYPAGVELVYPTAPIRLKLADIPGALSGPESASHDEDSSDAWAWVRRDPLTGVWEGVEATFDYLAEVLRAQGEFVGVIGFSQGAAIAAMLASLMEGPARMSSFADHQASGGIAFPEPFRSLQHPPFKFAVAYSGFFSPGARYAACYEPKIQTPVLHFVGSLDGVVDEASSMRLARACVGGEDRVVYHPGGHFVPGAKPFVGVLMGFLKEALREQDEQGGGGMKANGFVPEGPNL
jgi:pimeloyl-ACP methyl ester carboxylesterase